VSTLRAAVVQAAPVPFDGPASLAKALKLIEEASAAGAGLIVFPEAFLSGYPKYLNFGASVGHRPTASRPLYRRYHESAIDVPGPVTEALGEACRRHGAHLVMGVIERDGGTVYCTALFFDAAGILLGKHRKVMPTAMERLIWGYGDGSTLGVHETAVGRVGAVICWENYMPMLRMAMYSRNVQLYCAPTVDDRETWPVSMRHIAFEGRCFVLSAVQFLTRADYPPDLQSLVPQEAAEPIIRGGSLIVGPQGNVLAGPHYGSEAILTAEIDLGQIVEGKWDLDVVGHYARPDIFRLEVDEAPKPPVSRG